MRKVRTPFLIVNPKSYLYGEKSLELAKAADRVAEDTGVEIFLPVLLRIFVTLLKTLKILL